MRLIPVIDLLRGEVVHGRGGRRAEYRPIQSQLAPGSDPETIAAALAKASDARELYVADLDAIDDGSVSWEALQGAARAQLPLLLDAGISDRERALEIQVEAEARGCVLGGIIVGLESVASPVGLDEIARVIPTRQRVFSLDLQSGSPLSGPAWESRSAEEIALVAVKAGYHRLIVLDLADVGTAEGTRTSTLCQAIRRRFPDIELIAGGGVRNTNDLVRLSGVGCDAALVASALHSRALSRTTLPARE